MSKPHASAMPTRDKAWWLLAFLVAWVLSPFLSAIAWACVLAHATWPLHEWFRRRCPGGRTPHAVASTFLITVAALCPIVVLALSIRSDLSGLATWGNTYLDRDVAELLDTVARIPIVGQAVHGWFDGQAIEMTSVRDLLHQWSAGVASWLLVLVGDVGRNLVRFGLTVCFLFLLYARGDRVAEGVRTVCRRAIGDEADTWLEVCAHANRAVVLSMLLAALIQGLVAGTGYWLFGLRAPVLLGLATAVASLLPFVGTLLVWGPACAFLLSAGQTWPALGLAAWGTLLIHPADNILRPWLVSGAVRLPFLLVFLGVVGGLAAFGLIGIVVGPMVLAVAWQALRTVLGATGADAGPGPG